MVRLTISCVFSCIQVLYYVTSNQNNSLLSMMSLKPSDIPPPQLVFQFINIAVTDIAIDWINEDIYYINSVFSSIEVWDMNTNLTREVIGSLHSPRKLLYSFSKRYYKSEC